MSRLTPSAKIEGLRVCPNKLGLKSGCSTEIVLLSVLLKLFDWQEQIPTLICYYCTGPDCRLWHCKPPDPPVHRIWLLHHGYSGGFSLTSQIFQGFMVRGVLVTPANHWDASRFSACSFYVLYLHSTSSGTIIKAHGLPLLCRWFTAISVILTWWSHCLGSYICLLSRHLCLDEGAQLCEDGAPCHLWKPVIC